MKKTTVIRAELRDLRKVAASLYFLNAAAKEAELERDKLIAALAEEGWSGAVVAEAGGVTRGWPSKLVDLFPPRYERWRAEHPDQLELLLEARKQLNLMIRRAKEASDGA